MVAPELEKVEKAIAKAHAVNKRLEADTAVTMLTDFVGVEWERVGADRVEWGVYKLLSWD